MTQYKVTRIIPSSEDTEYLTEGIKRELKREFLDKVAEEMQEGDTVSVSYVFKTTPAAEVLSIAHPDQKCIMLIGNVAIVERTYVKERRGIGISQCRELPKLSEFFDYIYNNNVRDGVEIVWLTDETDGNAPEGGVPISWVARLESTVGAGMFTVSTNMLSNKKLPVSTLVDTLWEQVFEAAKPNY